MTLPAASIGPGCESGRVRSRRRLVVCVLVATVSAVLFRGSRWALAQRREVLQSCAPPTFCDAGNRAAIRFDAIGHMADTVMWLGLYVFLTLVPAFVLATLVRGRLSGGTLLRGAAYYALHWAIVVPAGAAVVAAAAIADVEPASSRTLLRTLLLVAPLVSAWIVTRPPRTDTSDPPQRRRQLLPT